MFGPIPSLSVFLIAGFLALFWSYACLLFAGYLKQELGVRTGYTRKVFHVLIFSSAVIVHAVWGFVAVCVFGSMVSIVVGHAVIGGPGNRLYEAIAREKDGPLRTYFVVVPYFATLIGGLISSALFGPLAIVGYLVGGLGDAAGEPVGTRWGKHGFWFGRKTFEGSIAVVVASTVALAIAVAVRPEFHATVQTMIAVPIIALVCGVVEVCSPRGWDNVSMQIVPTVLAAFFFAR